MLLYAYIIYMYILYITSIFWQQHARALQRPLKGSCPAFQCALNTINESRKLVSSILC